MALAEHVEQQFGASLAEGNEAECDYVLATVKVRTPCQVQDPHFVERSNGLEAVQQEGLTRAEGDRATPGAETAYWSDLKGPLKPATYGLFVVDSG